MRGLLPKIADPQNCQDEREHKGAQEDPTELISSAEFLLFRCLHLKIGEEKKIKGGDALKKAVGQAKLWHADKYRNIRIRDQQMVVGAQTALPVAPPEEIK